MSIAATLKALELERVNNAELGEKISAKHAALKGELASKRAQVNAMFDHLDIQIDNATEAIEREIEARDQALLVIIQGDAG